MMSEYIGLSLTAMYACEVGCYCFDSFWVWGKSNKMIYKDKIKERKE